MHAYQTAFPIETNADGTEHFVTLQSGYRDIVLIADLDGTVRWNFKHEEDE